MGKLNEYPDVVDLTGDEKIIIEQSLRTHSIELNKIIELSSFDQELNTTDAVEFDCVTSSEPWIVHTTTAANEGITGILNKKYVIDTSLSTANIIITIPSLPSLGNTITVMDMKENFMISGSKNVRTNAILFEGHMDWFEFDVSNSSIQLVYTGSSYGWKQVK